MPEEFVHRFEPGTGTAGRVLLALHGTGGDEHDLVPLARMIDPGAAVLSPRGRVLENGMPRFFRRLAEGVFDLDDLRVRTQELAAFVETAAAKYGFEPSRVVAVGYSNGANIAASLLLSETAVRPAGAVLLRPMVPFEPAQVPALQGTRVLIAASRQDPIVRPELTERLAALLDAGGAEVTMRWYPTGHGLSSREVEDAAAWYAERF